MKGINPFFILVFISYHILAQDGKIVERSPLVLSDSVFLRLEEIEPGFSTNLKGIDFYRISYLSDGFRVTGYAAEPKTAGEYPCIIFNRGGNREFGKLSHVGIAYILGSMASWGYVAIASQYRGTDGGEGLEEFGGQELNDVMNLIPALAQFPKADTSRIGISGGSRGGMMTYLAMKRSCKFKAAAVFAGVANAFVNIAHRPNMEKDVYSELVPNYWADKDNQLRSRSAVFWAKSMCKTTPLLMMHGSSDWRVSPLEAFELLNRLYEVKHPVRFILFEGADHGISEFRQQLFSEIRRHFDHYVRDGKGHPSMEPHGP